MLEGGRGEKQVKESHLGVFEALEEGSGCCRVAAPWWGVGGHVMLLEMKASSKNLSQGSVAC